MKIEKSELVQKLNKLKSIVPKRPSVEALEGVLVKDGYLIANNLEVLVKAKLKGVEDNETFIIPERSFDLINNLPEGEMEIIAGTKNTVGIKSVQIKNTYKSVDPINFPLPDISSKNGGQITIKSETLLESMKKVSYAIASQSTREPAKALCLDASGNILNFVGFDGYMLAWDKVDFEGEFELLIPKTTVEKLLSIGLTGDVAINYNEYGVLFVTDDYEVYTRVIDGSYFAYKNMIKEMPLQATVDRKSLLNALIRTKMCAKELSVARFDFNDNQLNISINEDTVDYNETVYLKNSLGADLLIGFNPRFVIETLKSFDCDEIKLSFTSAKVPMLVEDKNSNFKAVIAPVTLK